MKKSFKFLAMAALMVGGFCGLAGDARADGADVRQVGDSLLVDAVLRPARPIPPTMFLAQAAPSSVTVVSSADSNSTRFEQVEGEKEILNAITGGKLGWLAAVFTWIGILRVVFKPGMAFVRAVIVVTPTKKDDQALDKAEHSAAAKTFFWLLDYLTSIKVGSQAKPSAK